MLSLLRQVLRLIRPSPRAQTQEAMDAATVRRLRARGVQIGEVVGSA